jgi:hypothetical protein
MNCQYCNRDINNKGSLKAHEMSCISNPNKIKHKHSDKSGAQKGSTPWNAGKELGRHPKWDKLYPDEVVFCENSTYARHSVKARIRTNNLIEYKCACCGLGPEWHGKPMPLILDHINGVNNDNRLENLRFVCSNCDSQLPTYKSKNRTNGR